MKPPISIATRALLLALAGPALAQMPGPVPPEAVAAARLNPRLDAGEAWIVDRATRLQSLTLAPGAALAAPAGQRLTLSVDGVETTARPGRYQGDLMLSVTAAHDVVFSPFGSPPKPRPRVFQYCSPVIVPTPPGL